MRESRLTRANIWTANVCLLNFFSGYYVWRDHLERKTRTDMRDWMMHEDSKKAHALSTLSRTLCLFVWKLCFWNRWIKHPINVMLVKRAYHSCSMLQSHSALTTNRNERISLWLTILIYIFDRVKKLKL